MLRAVEALAEVDRVVGGGALAVAKGRVERAHQTLQDRLVKELRLRRVSTVDGANALVDDFVRSYDTRFGSQASRGPKESGGFTPPGPPRHRPRSARLILAFALDSSRVTRWLRLRFFAPATACAVRADSGQLEHAVKNQTPSIGVGYRWVSPLACARAAPLHLALDLISREVGPLEGLRLFRKDANLPILQKFGLLSEHLERSRAATLDDDPKARLADATRGARGVLAAPRSRTRI